MLFTGRILQIWWTRSYMIGHVCVKVISKYSYQLPFWLCMFRSVVRRHKWTINEANFTQKWLSYPATFCWSMRQNHVTKLETCYKICLEKIFRPQSFLLNWMEFVMKMHLKYFIHYFSQNDDWHGSKTRRPILVSTKVILHTYIESHGKCQNMGGIMFHHYSA